MPSPVKWLTDQAYQEAHVSEKALAWADHFVGEKEQGHNAGPFVAMLLKALSLPTGNAWCAAFVSHCLKKAGYEGGPKGSKRASVKQWADWAFEKGVVTKSPMRGDLFFWLNNNGTGHIGFYLGPDGDGMRVIDGNTDVAGSREGDGVYKHTRPRGASVRFIRWWLA